MVPTRPFGSARPPRWITVCPSSPAAPRPCHILRLSTMPLPTPVPHQIPTKFCSLRPAPSSSSPSTATPTSLPSFTFAPQALPTASAKGYASANPDRFGACERRPRAALTAPGAPMPMPLSAFVEQPASLHAASIAPTIASTTLCGPPSCGVGTRHCPRSLRSALTTTTSIFVPPRSTPQMRSLMAGETTTLRNGDEDRWRRAADVDSPA